MLRGFNTHFNETVFRGPDNEGGGGDVPDDTALDVGGAADIGGADDIDGAGGEEVSDKPLTVREQLKKSIAEASEPTDKKPRSDKSGRFVDRKAKGQEAEVAAKPVEAPTGTSGVPAPESLSKEAKAEWDKAPPAIQQAFIKREQDMANGVAELKQRYAGIDQALAPHTDALRQMNATPADAVNRMFLWFKALAGTPSKAFPGLAQSLGMDWGKIVEAARSEAGGQQPQQVAGQQQEPTGAAPEIPEPVRQYVGNLENHVQQLTQYVQSLGGQLGGIQNNFNAQSEAKARDNVSIWAKDKEFYEDVRQDMAKLIQNGMIPLLPGEQVDLDTAYERAIYFNPEVRAKVLAKQQQADNQLQQQSKVAATTAQQTQVGKARKAAVSIPVTNAPGQAAGQLAAKRKPGQKLSVRDSLKAAMAELRDQ